MMRSKWGSSVLIEYNMLAISDCLNVHIPPIYFSIMLPRNIYFLGQIRRNECERYFNHFASISVDEKNKLLVCMLFGKFNLKEKVRRIHIYS